MLDNLEEERGAEVDSMQLELIDRLGFFLSQEDLVWNWTRAEILSSDQDHSCTESIPVPLATQYSPFQGTRTFMLNILDNNTFRPKTRSKACERGHTGEQSPGSVIICSLQEKPVSLGHELWICWQTGTKLAVKVQFFHHRLFIKFWGWCRCSSCSWSLGIREIHIDSASFYSQPFSAAASGAGTTKLQTDMPLTHWFLYETIQECWDLSAIRADGKPLFNQSQWASDKQQRLHCMQQDQDVKSFIILLQSSSASTLLRLVCVCVWSIMAAHFPFPVFGK